MEMRTVLLALVCLSIVCLLAYSMHVERNEERLRMQRLAHRQAYVHLLKESDDKKTARQREFVNALRISAATPGWSRALDVAKTYHRGCFPDFVPNTAMASSIYSAIISKCEDTVLVSEARGAQHQCILDEDVAGIPLPLDPGNAVLARIRAMIAVPPVVVRIRTTPPRPVRTEIEKLTDTQNVHDHGVTASMKSTLDALRAEGCEVDEDAKEKIESLLFSETLDMSDEDKAKALAVLESLKDTKVHSTLGVTESEALRLVWAKLGASSTETLCKQLASGFERGTPVCSTGKIARIVSALDGMTTDTRSITPMWAVREELGSLAAKIRAETLDAVSEMHRSAYERGDSMEVEDTMRATFKKHALETYCETLGMQPSVILPIVDALAAGF